MASPFWNNIFLSGNIRWNLEADHMDANCKSLILDDSIDRKRAFRPILKPLISS